MFSEVSPGDKSLQIAGLDEETLALMYEAVRRQDGTYAIDPVAHTMKRVVRFPRPPAQRAVASARSPRRRSVRRVASRARGPDDPEPEPPLDVVPVARFRRDVRRWLEVGRP